MPTPQTLQNQKYQGCIDACNRCAESCEFCATSCLREKVRSNFVLSSGTNNYID